MIEARTGIKPDEQVLVVGSKPIRTDPDSLQMTLSDYNIQKDNTIMIGLRLRGGGILELIIKYYE
jgi:hypothetical protein